MGFRLHLRTYAHSALRHMPQFGSLLISMPFIPTLDEIDSDSKLCLWDGNRLQSHDFVLFGLNIAVIDIFISHELERGARRRGGC